MVKGPIQQMVLEQGSWVRVSEASCWGRDCRGMQQYRSTSVEHAQVGCDSNAIKDFDFPEHQLVIQ